MTSMQLARLALPLIGVFLPFSGQQGPTPVAVKATAAAEVQPVAGAHFFAWSRSRPDGKHFDLYVQSGNRTVRVNLLGTQAFAGGSDGARISYLQMQGSGHSFRESLRLYNVVRGTRTTIHPGLGNVRFDPPSIGHQIIAFEWHSFASDNLSVYDLRTKKTLRLAHAPVGIGPYIADVRAAGRYISWIECSNQCDLVEYSSGRVKRLATGVQERLAATAVMPDGTVYVTARSAAECGPPVSIWRYTADGARSSIFTLPQGFGIRSMSAVRRTDGSTHLFFDRGRCKRGGLTDMNIYSLVLS